MGAYATPALVGGSRVRVAVTEIATQVTTVFNWPLAAALSIVLLFASLVLGPHGAAGLAQRHPDVNLGKLAGLMQVLFPPMRADMQTWVVP